MTKFILSTIIVALCVVLVAGESRTQDQSPSAAVAEADQAPPIIEDVDLQDLIDSAADGDTLTIPSGTYINNHGLVIEDREDLTIICQSPVNIYCRDTDADVLTIEESSGITIAGAHLRHFEPLEEYQCHGGVVRIVESSDVLLYRCELDGCGAIGASVRSSKDVHVNKCHIHDNSFVAFYLDDSEDVKITESRIDNNKSMLASYSSDDQSLEMWGNTIENNTGYWEHLREEKIHFRRLDGKIGIESEEEGQ